ncbi:Uncharacterized protein TCAP_01364 [Tolypocladium capitatum]|uniref:Uncharacterized protein n=1 Tax=Tolypocladium capitatum TaxID=45235 RepID=A0A2K3QME9_9HYPO|nr:Uncharacterized protein TCAP_01364 [Tolypocladium capitatum]
MVRMGSRFCLVALVAALVVGGLAAAEPATSIATVFCVADAYTPVLASVIEADATATEFLLRCGVPFEDGRRRRRGHAANDDLILTHGPSTMALTGRDETCSTRGSGCKLQGSWPARCDFVFVDGEYALWRGHVPLRAELEKLAAATASGGNKRAGVDTAARRSMATRLGGTGTTILDDTTRKTTVRRTTAPIGSRSSAEVKPTDRPRASTTADKGGSAAGVALLGAMLGPATARGVL